MLTPVTAPITDVTVYINHARVTRRGTVQLDEGEHTLVLSPITTLIEQDSVRAGGYGAGITIRSVDVKQNRLVRNPDKQIQELDDEWTEHWDANVKLEDKAKTLQTKLNLLEKLGTESGAKFAEHVTRDTLSFDNITQMMAYIVAESDHARAQLREIVAQQIDLKKKVDVLKHKRAQLSTGKNVDIREIHVLVEAENTQTEFEFEVSYNVKQALWEPIYDVRLDDDDEVSLSYMATIEQKTGESWDDVNLSLSTSRSSGTTNLPKLSKWQVSYVYPERQYQATLQKEMLHKPVSAQYIPNGYDARPVAKQLTSNMRQTSLKNISATSTLYDIAGQVTIPQGGEPHQVTIVIEKLKVDLDYITVPRTEKTCHLRATITNTSEFTLLPGTASIFHEGNYVGKTSLNTVAPNESFKAHLGIDDRIRVKRQLMKRDQSKGFLGTSQKIERAYRITLNNYLDKSAKITVKDSYPTSKDSGLKVTLDSVTPTPTEQTDLHELTWDIEIPSNSEQVITYAFSVEGSGAKHIFGL